jgi:hypothetical protein
MVIVHCCGSLDLKNDSLNFSDGEKFCLDTSKLSLEKDVGKDFGDFLLNFIVHPALNSLEKRGAKVDW